MEKGKVLLFAIIGLLVVLLGAVIAIAILLIPKINTLMAPPEYYESFTPSAIQKNLTPNDIEQFSLDGDIKVNLKESSETKSSTRNVLSIKVTIGIDKTDKKESPAFIEEVKASEAIIKDTITSICRTKTFQDIKHPDSKELLAAEILVKLQELFESNLIYKVYIPEYLYS